MRGVVTVTPGDRAIWKPPEGAKSSMFKLFEKYRLGERAMLYLWHSDP